jgi:hypothetical protein
MAYKFKRLAHHDTTAPANQPIYNGFQDQLNVDEAEPVASVQRDEVNEVIPTAAPRFGMGSGEKTQANKKAVFSRPSEHSEVKE